MQVYADNAATTKPSRTALDAMLPCFEQFYGNPSSLHHVGQAAAEVLLQARQDMADCLGCEAREIYFTSGGSEADNQALRSAAWAGARKGKKHIVSTAFEHHAVLHTLEQLKEEGFTVTLLDVHETGRITPEEVEAAIQPDTCLVSVMYANNEIGTIEPIAEIGAVCRKHGVPFHTDAVQAAGHVPIHVRELRRCAGAGQACRHGESAGDRGHGGGAQGGLCCAAGTHRLSHRTAGQAHRGTAHHSPQHPQRRAHSAPAGERPLLL